MIVEHTPAIICRGSAAASGSPTATTPEQRDGPATKKDGGGPVAQTQVLGRIRNRS